MKTGTNLPNFGIGLLSTFILLVVLLHSCQGDPVDVPDEDVFTKTKREQLGKLLMNDILTNNEFIPDFPPYDSAYNYIQTLYSQATNVMQLDRQSPSDNRWKGDWEIYIINNDDMRHAFTLPGGNLFITTGMLKHFEKDYELFYLLTFEANLMHEGHLLNLLKEEYNSLTLINLIEGRATASGITISDVAEDLPDLKFDDGIIKNADRETVSSICGTSILAPTGILPSLFNTNFQDCKWLESRPSYGNRPSSVQGFADDNSGNCGGNLGNGNYQKFVLDVLD
ncbi:MAG: hypothetical protein AAFZ15_31335 [Bacteroidota bacterium]